MYGRLIPSSLEVLKKEEVEKLGLSPEHHLSKLTEIQNKILENIKTNLECIDNENMLSRVRELPILEISTLVLYNNSSKKNKQDLDFTGPYLVTNKNRDFYELTSLTKDTRPFWVHARKIKRYHLNNDHTPTEVALMDTNKYEIKNIHSHTDENSYMNKRFDCRYEKAPDDPQWKYYNEIKFEKAFVEYCYKLSYPGWINKANKAIHPELIKTLEENKRKEGEMREAAKMKQAKEREDKRILDAQAATKKRKRTVDRVPTTQPKMKRKRAHGKTPSTHEQPNQQMSSKTTVELKNKITSRSGRIVQPSKKLQ